MLGAAVFFAFSARPRPHRPKGARLLVPTSWIPTRPLPHHSFAHHQQKARAASRIGLKLAQSAFWRGDFLLLLARSQSILEYLYEPSHRIASSSLPSPPQPSISLYARALHWSWSCSAATPSITARCVSCLASIDTSLFPFFFVPFRPG